MKVDLQGRGALVTGGAHGIGRAIVQALADNGARVAIVDLDPEKGETAAAEVRAGGGECVSIPGDVTDADRMRDAAGEAAARLGGLHLLVNNAGINTRSDRVPVHQYSPEDWQRLLDVDLHGVFHTRRCVVPYLLQAGGGRIVNIS